MILGKLNIEQGIIVSQSEKLSPKEYVQKCKQAAKQGNVIAQNTLGFLYLNGQGVSQDYEQAASWFRKAADQEYRDAQYNLSVMYKLGQGVEQDNAESLKWLEKAAFYGHAAAQNSLGDLYYQGKDREKDYVSAYMWWELAEKNDFENIAHKKVELAKKMTMADLKHAEQLARQHGKH